MMSPSAPMMGATRPRLIVFGNEKGGSGKSTAAVHVAVGWPVPASASRRLISTPGMDRCRAISQAATAPCRRRRQVAIARSDLPIVADAEEDERGRLDAAIGRFGSYEFIVLDTPGSDSNLTRLAQCARRRGW